MAEPKRRRRRSPSAHHSGPHLFPGRTPEIRRRQKRTVLTVAAFCALAIVSVFLIVGGSGAP